VKSITRQQFSTPPTCAFGAQADLTQATNYQDLWWNAPANSESGWGINFAHQGDIIFATWFTYGLESKATWLSVTAPKTATKTYTGTLYRTSGPAFMPGVGPSARSGVRTSRHSAVGVLRLSRFSPCAEHFLRNLVAPFVRASQSEGREHCPALQLGNAGPRQRTRNAMVTV